MGTFAHRIVIDEIIQQDDWRALDDAAGMIAKSSLEQLVLDDDGEDNVSCSPSKNEQI